MAKRKWADLAVWYYSDDKNEVERKIEAKWRHCENPSFIDANKYRKKERKFEDGHWYPTVDSEGDMCVMIFKRNGFCLARDQGFGDPSSEFSFIGESLGRLNFGGKDE